MKKLTLIILSFLCYQFSIAQNTFEKFDIADWAEIAVPNTLELQSGIYKEIIDAKKHYFSLNAERVVFQQNGVNNGENLKTYARIIIRKDLTNENLPDLNTTSITNQDLSDVNDIYKSEIYALENNTTFPVEITKWNKVKITTLNNNKAFTFSYIRQMGNNPKTYSEVYVFWKGYNQYMLNIEYRLNDSQLWKSDLDKAVSTFKLK